MTPDEKKAILDELGVDGLILKSYPLKDPIAIALMRIHHACENAATALDWCADLLARFLENPTEYLADEAAAEAARGLAAKLHVLEGELLKSLPALEKGRPRAEGADPGLRDKAAPPTREGQRPPDDHPGDWEDVPF